MDYVDFATVCCQLIASTSPTIVSQTKAVVVFLAVLMIPWFATYCGYCGREKVPAQPAVESKKSVNKKSQRSQASHDSSRKISEDSEPTNERSSSLTKGTEATDESLTTTRTQSSKVLSKTDSSNITNVEGTQHDGTDVTQLGSEGDLTDVNIFVLKAAQNQTVVHPSLVKKKGSIEFKATSKEDIKELEAAMKSDHEQSERESLNATETTQPTTIKWGDSKCVVYETSEDVTFDDDEVPEDPDLW
ncbi:hypothetical protein Q1695_015121 [Nippostrongylus brasiliensis]|nr:hypothetical protein Q1695_015121 [Nippostrongylus brasiliensis]